MSNDRDVCQVPRCDRHADLVYYSKGICRAHWQEHAHTPADELKALLNGAPVLASNPPPR